MKPADPKVASNLAAWLGERGLPVPAPWLEAADAVFSLIEKFRPCTREGRWIAAVFADRDFVDWLGDDGVVYHDVDEDEPLIPIAASIAIYWARWSFWKEAMENLGDRIFDPRVDFETTDPALVAALDLPRVDAVSDRFCERFRDGDFVACVVHPSSFVERGKTRIYARDTAALIARVIAIASRPEARGIAITVFGWPNQRTGDVTRALAAALPDHTVRERNDYIGPIEPSDFVR
jgi:hypothetical protein